VEAVCEGPHISERRACKALGQHRSSQRRRSQLLADEDALTAAVIDLARSFGRSTAHRRKGRSAQHGASYIGLQLSPGVLSNEVEAHEYGREQH
jgi:hypothetical protein